MSYVSAIYDKNKDLVKVVERDNAGMRIFKNYPAEHTFYYPDAKGKHRSVYGDRLAKFTSHSNNDYQREKKMMGYKTLFESDFNPVGRCLEKNYAKIDPPKLHTAFFDIEVNYDGCKYPDDKIVKIRKKK